MRTGGTCERMRGRSDNNEQWSHQAARFHSCTPPPQNMNTTTTTLSLPEVDGVRNVLHRCYFKNQEMKWFSGNKAWRINGLERTVLAPLTQNHTSKLIEDWWLHRKLLSMIVICTTEIPVLTSQGCCDHWLGGLRKTSFTRRAPYWN